LKNSNLENNHPIDKYRHNDFLLDYIHHRLTDEERLAFESYLEQDEMLRDAVEGLQTIENTDNLPVIQTQLKDFLRHHTQKGRPARRRPDFHFVIWVSIAILLLLICLAGIYIFYSKR